MLSIAVNGRAMLYVPELTDIYILEVKIMEEQFKEILAQYTTVDPVDMTDDVRFREDMELSSLDFMTLLGEVEDTFDIEFHKSDAEGIYTVGDAITLIRRKMENE